MKVPRLEERTQHPLGPYVLSHDFVRSAEGLSNLVRDRLAYVCAMIACSRVETPAALAQSPLPPNPHAHHDHDSLSGNQSAWQCRLTRQDSQSPAGRTLPSARRRDDQIHGHGEL